MNSESENTIDSLSQKSILIKNLHANNSYNEICLLFKALPK